MKKDTPMKSAVLPLTDESTRQQYDKVAGDLIARLPHVKADGPTVLKHALYLATQSLEIKSNG